MELFDKLIPLVVLVHVAIFLAILVRRRIREAMPQRELGAPLLALRASEPVELPPPKLEVVAPPAPTAAIATVTPRTRVKTKRKRVESATTGPAVEQTPVVTVVNLLQKKDALVAAFLLHEILAPPVSKRKRFNAAERRA